MKGEGSGKNRAVFLDRDNTIIEDNNGYIDSPKKVRLLPSAARAIKKLNDNGFKVIVITNQSGIGRGYFTEDTLEEIHKEMVDLLKKRDAALDGIYFCPHHPEAIIDEYKKICPCRKPAIGLVVKAALDHNIDLLNSYFIGDKEDDVKTGKNAGCLSYKIHNDIIQEESISDKIVRNLNEAVEDIILLSSQ